MDREIELGTFTPAQPTLRQYYAAAALQGILAGVANHDMAAAMAEGVKGGRIEAAAAFAWADALIAQEQSHE